MFKEFFICIIIILLILIGNGITQGYCENSIESINQKLDSFEETIISREEVSEEDKQKIKQQEEEIYSDWEEMFSKLAYYIEHEELEKFSKNLENLKTYIKLEEYNNAVKEINEGIFILNHIEDKYSFNLQNIF